MISIIPSISKERLDKAIRDSGVLEKLKKYSGATFETMDPLIVDNNDNYTLWYSNNLYLSYVLGLYGFDIMSTESGHCSLVDITQGKAFILAPKDSMGFVVGRKGKNVEKLREKHNIGSVTVKTLNNPRFHLGGLKAILELCAIITKCSDDERKSTH